MSWEIPDPFLREDGTRITEVGQWEEQRDYLKRILLEDLYGEMPPKPEQIKEKKLFEKELWEGLGRFSVVELTIENSVVIKAVSVCPAHGKSIPVVFCGGYVEETIARNAIEQGFCIITPLMEEAAPDRKDYKEGTLYKAYPEYSFKTIAMWAWLMSRVIDWLEGCSFADPETIIAAGHSRYGKAALCLGVFDERVSMVVTGGSGCGGMGSLRIGGGRYGLNTGKTETLGSMTRDNFPHWFRDGIEEYGAQLPGDHFREDEMRFDADFIAAAIAPRPFLLIEGLDDTWANPWGTLLSWSAAAEVYHFLGADSACGIHFREGGHAFAEEDWDVLLAFCRKQLGKECRDKRWHIRAGDEPRIGRGWTAPGEPEVQEALLPDYSMTPERLQAMKERLNRRWAFAEAGLETENDRFLRKIIGEAEKRMK